MSGEEDDKATVVIDLNALRREKENKEKEIAGLADALSFGTDLDLVAESSQPVLFFDFGTKVFAPLAGEFPAGMDCKIISDLPSLNAWIKKKEPVVLVFAFDANPKAVNQLSAQLKAKFKHVTTVLAAKNLSPDKIRAHQASVAGAHAYIKMPFARTELGTILKKLVDKKAA